MSCDLEELRQKVVAIVGDELLCPACQEPLLLFTTPTFRSAQVLPGAVQIPADRPHRFTLHCRQCGAGAVQQEASTGYGIEDAIGPRAYVRSGPWTGWRALGGE